MKQFFLAKQYLAYRLQAKNLHGVHSPFVYAFNKDVVNDTRNFYAFEAIKNLRELLQNNKNTVTITDFGAGSKHTKSNVRRIADIAKLAGKQHKHGALLYKMIDAYQSKNILELGTSVGIGTSYMASSNTSAKVTTIEGCQAIADVAAQNFNFLKLQNVQQVVGNFDVVLDAVLKNNAAFDFVFIDGNHRYEPTINYLKKILPHLRPNAILVFDDIHWSSEMYQAWKEIVATKSIPLTVDVFQFGICFFNEAFKEKQHFVIKF